MVMVAVCGGRSCGITTAALAIASQWGDRPVVLAECDPAGSSLTGMVKGWDGQPLSTEVGVQSLGVNGGTLDAHVQTLHGGLPVLVGPRGPEQATALGAGWTDIAAGLRRADRDVVVDCGRVTARDSLVSPVLAASDLVVVMARADVTGASQLHADLRRVAEAVAFAGDPSQTNLAVVVADAPSSPSRRSQARQVDEVVASLPQFADVPVVGVMAWDWRTAGVLAGHRVGSAWSRWLPGPLIRSGRTIAAAIHQLTGPSQQPAATPAAADEGVTA